MNMHYYYGILKAILCALTQSLGMMIIMVDYVQVGVDCRDIHSEMESDEIWEAMCPLEVFNFQSSARFFDIFLELQYKILAFLFSAFLGMFPCTVSISIVHCCFDDGICSLFLL